MTIKEIKEKFISIKTEYEKTRAEAYQLIEESEKMIVAKAYKKKLSKMYLLIYTISTTISLIGLLYILSGMILPALLSVIVGALIYVKEPKIKSLIYKIIAKHVLKNEYMNSPIQELTSKIRQYHTFIDLDLSELKSLANEANELYTYLINKYPVTFISSEESLNLIYQMSSYLYNDSKYEEPSQTVKRKIR